MLSLVLLASLQFTAGIIDGAKWKLAFNIHASDGHNFGYTAKAWNDENDVGTSATAFTADYKNYNVTIETANFIAIARHQNGVCEAARVWEFLENGKTLRSYLQASRLRATKDLSTYSYIPNGMENKKMDPIFSVDGGLVFNWVHSDNGVRIGNSKAYSGDGLPHENENKDNYQGIGNDWNPTPIVAWHDVGLNQPDGSYLVQGTDHGTSLKSGKLYGQYAIYISNSATTFPCENVNLKISMFDLDKAAFDRIDRYDIKGFLTYNEFVFDIGDSNKDGFLSLKEYSEARDANRFRETISDADAWTDFYRIDKDGDGLLNYDDLAFAMADTNKDGKLSLVEYSQARADGNLSETDDL